MFVLIREFISHTGQWTGENPIKYVPNHVKEAAIVLIATSFTAHVNSEVFTRNLFSRNFAKQMQSFVKIKSSRNPQITLSFTDMGKSCPYRKFLTPQICLSA